jgi:hypothetical protein
MRSILQSWVVCSLNLSFGLQVLLTALLCFRGIALFIGQESSFVTGPNCVPQGRFNTHLRCLASQAFTAGTGKIDAVGLFSGTYHSTQRRKIIMADHTPDIAPTELIYHSYEGNFQLECTAKVLWSKYGEPQEGTTEAASTLEIPIDLALNRTTMHAQGGGQPTDIGTITLVNKDGGSNQCSAPLTVATIEKVMLDRETKVASHAGRCICASSRSASSPPFPVGSTVLVSVDPDERRILSECHTAGHVVDAAMARCNQALPASKAYHFLDSPYVVSSAAM